MKEMERYTTFPEYCRKTFGHKLFRIALDAGMTCPNRDGTKGYGGCIFCAGGSGDFAVRYEGQKLDLSVLKYIHHPEEPAGYIAYFQAYTNTYAPTERLEYLFTSALQDPLFEGISIATRPDCLDEEVLCVLQKLKQTYPEKFIWIELGLQSIHEDSVVWMRRGYPLDVFDKAVQELKKLDIPVIVHVILGLPGETPQMVLETIRYLNRTGIQGIKLQLLQILEGTDLAEEYRKGKVRELSEEEYISLLTACVAELDPQIVIHRLTGDGNPKILLAPLWSLNKRQVLNHIMQELKTQNIVQGYRYGTSG
ncbi:MAG: TIGR01212 family radical SAM protein [Solobacterium sp.]|nr:TIGR01212 family radical SAM protein [Solobacterium sp.]